MFQGHADADDDQLEDDLANAELVDEADYEAVLDSQQPLLLRLRRADGEAAAAELDDHI